MPQKTERILGAATLALLGCMVACGGGSESTPPPSPATQLAISIVPATIPAGVSISPAIVVTMQDATGRTARGSRGFITVSIGTNPAGGSLSGAATTDAVDGVATFTDLSINKVGAGYTLTASSQGLTGATSGAFNVVAGQPSRLAFSAQPTAAWMGATIGPAVTVRLEDNVGNLVTTTNANVTMAVGANPGAATLGGTVSAASVNGIATFSNLSLDNAGVGVTLVASAPSLTSATSDTFTTIGFASVSTGRDAACAQTNAKVTYCWGANGSGQLGNGTNAPSAVPTPVGGGVAFASVDAGNRVACGVTAAGAGYCWGDNGSGQLGDGSNQGSSTPVPIFGGLTFKIVRAATAADSATSCGLATTNTVYCWGDNRYGQIGNLTFTNSNTPKQIASGANIGRGLSVNQVVVCALSNGGTVFCWGNPAFNRLGNLTPGTTNPATGNLGVNAPVIVGGGLDYSAVSGSCALFIVDAAAYCWGLNDRGQVGDGTTTNREIPVAVSGGLSFTEISSGPSHVCALTPTNVAYCWGNDDDGQLGNGPSSASKIPAAVAGGLHLAHVSAGLTGTCGVTTGGALYCWGLVGSSYGDAPVRIANPN